MKHIFIVNPISGGGKANEYLPLIQQYFESSSDEYQIIMTEHPKHATEIAKSYNEEDDVILYSIGGDGTMKEILDGINENVRLCIIPGGTGNDFYKSINMKPYSRKEILEASIQGEDVNLDYGLFNNTSKFLNIISFGLDAAINKYACEVVKVEKNLGQYTYAYATLKVGLKPETYHMVLTVDNQKYEDDMIIMAIANGSYYGGMFNAFPKADLTDGVFDGCYFRPMGLLKLLPAIMKYMKGAYQDHPKCTNFQGQAIHIEFDREIPVQVDGENSMVKVVDIQMNHGKQRFRMQKFNN